MQKLKAEKHILLPDNVLKILGQNRITTILDFLEEDPDKLTVLTKLTLPQVLTVREDILRKYSAPVVNGTTFLIKNMTKQKLISTKIQSLDTVLEGGIPIGYIIEICGLAASGKTQLCMQLAINCVKDTNNTVLYVDTKGDFSAIRIQKVLDACGYSHKDMAMIMFKLKVVHIWTIEEMIELLKKIKNRELQFENLILIIIDSLPCLTLQYLGDENKVGLTLLNTFVNYSRFLCKEFNLSIVCVNIQTRWVDQDTTDIEDDGDQSTTITKDSYKETRNRCLGKYWQNIPLILIVLEKSQEYNNDNSFQINVNVIKTTRSHYSACCTIKDNEIKVCYAEFDFRQEVPRKLQQKCAIILLEKYSNCEMSGNLNFHNNLNIRVH